MLVSIASHPVIHASMPDDSLVLMKRGLILLCLLILFQKDSEIETAEKEILFSVLQSHGFF
jgi:hypothetical protein